MVLFSSVALRPCGRDWASLPLGPSALTRPFSTWTLTPWGIATGFLPIRDLVSLVRDVGEELAADVVFTRLAVGQHTLGRRHDRHAHTAQNGRDLLVADVDPAPRRGHAHEPRDHLLVGRPVLQVNAQHP